VNRANFKFLKDYLVIIFLPLKDEPRLEICRDGGSITASFTDFQENSYTLTLTVRWGYFDGNNRGVIGYQEPILEKYIKNKRISKGDGKPYFVTSTINFSLQKQCAINIAKKISMNAKQQHNKELAEDLLYGIEFGVRSERHKL